MPLLTYNELGTGIQKSAGSIREDLLDVIENISPADTPLWNNLSQIGVHAGFVEYLEDVLNAATTNAFIEGAAATDPTLLTPVRTASIVQNFQKHVQVSARQRVVNHAGLSDMLAYQRMKALKEIKNDVELMLHRGSAVSGTTTVAAQSAGMLNRLVTNFTSSSGTTLTERVYNDIITLAYANPVNIRETYGNMLVKRTINNYTTNVQRYMPAGDKRQVNIVNVYESEMGIQAIFTSRYQLQASSVTASGNSFIAIDPDYFAVGILRPFVTKTLGLDGDRDREFIVGELTLLAKAEKAGVGGTGFVANIPQ